LPYLAYAQRTSRKASVLFLLTAVGLAVAPSWGSAAEDAPSDQGILSSTQWSASVLSHHAGGTVCWVFGSDGSLRVEVFQDHGSQTDAAGNPGDLAALDLAPLLTRTGDGWTLVLGPDDTGTLNAWNREWREVPVGLAQMVRLVTTSLRDYPVRPPENSQVRAVGISGRAGPIARPRILAAVPHHLEDQEVWRYQLASLELQDPESMQAPGFRKNMVTRGRGTGGPGEILVLRWIRQTGQNDQTGYGLSISSSRRPGEFSLQPPQRQEVPRPEPEVFLPLWSLSQFFKIR